MRVLEYVLACAASAAACILFASSAKGEVPAEQLSVAKLLPANAHRVYIPDLALPHIVDGKLHVVDGEKLKYLGLIPLGYAGQSTLSPDRKEIYVATTYYTRLSRGERAEVLDIWDAETLTHKGEIPIPPKHAQALNYKGTIRTSADGRFVLIQNATPASSVSVVDLTARKFVAEIPTPGCWIVIPSQTVANRFSTICGDGTLMTFVLDAEGKPQSSKRSRKFFDPQGDPIFVQTENVGERHFFVSFKGNIHTADLSGEEATFEPAWPLLGKTDEKLAWRPGGYQPLAVHRASGRLFVAMHSAGKEGSHKDPAREIWVFDLASKKRIGKLPGRNAIAIAASQDEAPLLFGIDGRKMGLVVFEAGKTLRFKGELAPLAETAFNIETQ